jgi:tRNA nucleotidyltransferase/poly(A) polymerase
MKISRRWFKILRAVRIGNYVGFEIDSKTEKALAENSHLLSNIAKERIREEFVKIIMSPEPMQGLKSCQKFGLLKYIIPELEKTISIEQGGAHKYDVWEHSLRALQYAAEKNFSLEVRLAALLHDIGKPKSKREGENKPTFLWSRSYWCKNDKKNLQDLKFSAKVIEKVTKLLGIICFLPITELIKFISS